MAGGRANRKGRSKRFIGRFIALEHGVMNSPAYESLSGDALKLLLAVWKRHDGANNGAISFSTREAAALLHGNKNTAAKRFRELVDKGFLAVENKGAFHVKVRHATTWRITLESASGRPPTRDYQRWRPAPSVAEDDTVTVPKNQNSVSRKEPNGVAKNDHARVEDVRNYHTVSTAVPVVPHKTPTTVSLRGTHIEATIPQVSQFTAPLQPSTCPSAGAVETSPLSSAARCPQGSKRVRALDSGSEHDLAAILASRLAKRNAEGEGG